MRMSAIRFWPINIIIVNIFEAQQLDRILVRHRDEEDFPPPRKIGSAQGAMILSPV